MEGRFMSPESEGRWLLLFHQIPPKPNYSRVKIWRRLQRLGAVALKNSVYVLPWGDQAVEDFQWLIKEIIQLGGEASLCEASFMQGLSDEQIQGLFNTARDADYSQIAQEARQLRQKNHVGKHLPEAEKSQLRSQVEKLQRRLAEVAALDFFGAPAREVAAGLVAGLQELLPEESLPSQAISPENLSLEDCRGRTWVTRRGIEVDRIASAWLIRRFIDPEAQFKFVPAKGYQPQAGELRFDMFDGEFTHAGDRCSFEVLLERLGVEDPALTLIAQIVHDLDVKDNKFGRPEVAGLDHLLAGMGAATTEDDVRRERGAAIFDYLYEYFRR
jgi:hypothetical protein